MSIKSSNDTIGNRTRDLPVCSVVIHDDDLSNLRLAVLELLTNLFSEQWVGGDGPSAWRARSPDLNPVYFYLWRYLNSTDFATELKNFQCG
jgi:hypothetical protein